MRHRRGLIAKTRSKMIITSAATAATTFKATATFTFVHVVFRTVLINGRDPCQTIDASVVLVRLHECIVLTDATNPRTKVQHPANVSHRGAYMKIIGKSMPSIPMLIKHCAIPMSSTMRFGQWFRRCRRMNASRFSAYSSLSERGSSPSELSRSVFMGMLSSVSSATVSSLRVNRLRNKHRRNLDQLNRCRRSAPMDEPLRENKTEANEAR